MPKVLGSKLIKRVALGLTLAGGVASSAIAQPAMSAMEQSPYEGPRTLTGLWADASRTGLTILCDTVKCNVVDVSDAENFRYEVTPISFDLPMGPNAKISVDKVSVTMSKAGVDDLQGLPRKSTIEVAGFGVSRELAMAIVGEMGLDPLTAQVVVADLAREKASLKIEAEITDIDLKAQLSIKLQSGDELRLGVTVFMPPAMRERMVRSPLDVSILDQPTPFVRMLSVAPALEPSILERAPLKSAFIEFTEFSVLDRVYAPLLAKEGADAEMAFWKRFLDAIANVPAGGVSEDARKTATMLFSFFSDWRATGRGARLTIEDPARGELTASTPLEDATARRGKYCSLETVAGVVIPIGLGALPYIWEDTPMGRQASRSDDPHAMGKMAVNAFDPTATGRFQEVPVWRNARCEAPVVRVELFNAPQ